LAQKKYLSYTITELAKLLLSTDMTFSHIQTNSMFSWPKLARLVGWAGAIGEASQRARGSISQPSQLVAAQPNKL